MDDRQALTAFAHHGDAEAFHLLLQRYQGMVYGACRRLLADASLAEDAAQETFAKLLHHAPKLLTGTSLQLGGWLYRTASTTALNLARGERSRAARERAWAQDTAALVASEPEELLEHLDEALARLPEEQQDLLVAYHFRGQTQVELAAAAGISQPAMKKRLDKAMDGLRRELRRGGLTVGLALLATGLQQAAAAEAPAGLSLQLGKLGTLTTALTGGGGSGIGLAGWIGLAVAGLLLGTASLYLLPDRPDESPVVERMGYIQASAAASAAANERAAATRPIVPMPALAKDQRQAGGGVLELGPELLAVDFRDRDSWGDFSRLRAAVHEPTGLRLVEMGVQEQLSGWIHNHANGLRQLRDEPGRSYPGVPALHMPEVFTGRAYRIELQFTTQSPGTFVNIFTLAITNWTPWVTHWENQEVPRSLYSGRRHTVVVDLLREEYQGKQAWDLSYSLDGVPMHRGRYYTDTADMLLYTRELEVLWHSLTVWQLEIPEGGLPLALPDCQPPVRDPAHCLPLEGGDGVKPIDPGFDF